jgi:hypothetical protein
MMTILQYGTAIADQSSIEWFISSLSSLIEIRKIFSFLLLKQLIQLKEIGMYVHFTGWDIRTKCHCLKIQNRYRKYLESHEITHFELTSHKYSKSILKSKRLKLLDPISVLQIGFLLY